MLKLQVYVYRNIYIDWDMFMLPAMDILAISSRRCSKLGKREGERVSHIPL